MSFGKWILGAVHLHELQRHGRGVDELPRDFRRLGKWLRFDAELRKRASGTKCVYLFGDECDHSAGATHGANAGNGPVKLGSMGLGRVEPTS